MRRHAAHIVPLIVALAIGIARGLGAQATTIALRGSILGTDGTVPGAAAIEVRSRETGMRRQATADRSGSYRVLGLTPGVYDISARAIGYRQLRREEVRLVLGQHAVVNVALEPGAVELAPSVVRAERALEVERTDVSTAVLQEDIASLPLNSRNVLNLAAIAPGIRAFGSEAGRSVPASGAMPASEPRFSNLYVDGIDWKGMYVGQVVGSPGDGSMIPQEAVREFRVYVNSYDAEYVRGVSHVVSAVTHRGGDKLEGSLFAFHQNQALTARSSFQTAKPPYGRQQVGGNLRGPLIPNRLFFSATYEGQFTDNFIDVRPGRPPEDPGIWDRFRGTFKAPYDVHNGVLRLTAPWGAHAVDAMWTMRRIDREGQFGTTLANRLLSHDAGVVGRSTVTTVLLRDTYATSSLTNELSLHLLDLHNRQSSITPGPTYLYNAIHIGRANFPVRIDDRHFRIANKTSYLLLGRGGEHHIKVGIEINRTHTAVFRPTNAEGVFRFATDTSTLPASASIAVGLNDPTSTREGASDIDGWVVGAYLQDQWQPTPSLTITAGLRYDADIDTQNQDAIAPWANDPTLHVAIGERYLNTGDRENDLDNLAPRVALSWDVSGNGRTFVRGGYGVMYDRLPLYGALPESREFGWRTYTFTNPGTTDPAELRRRIATGGRTAAPPNIILLKDDLEAPENHQWSLGLGRRLGDAVAVNVDYVNQRTRNVYVSVPANLPRGPTATRPISPSYGTITIWDDFGDARFDAVLASLAYHRRAMRFNVAYTLGWAQSEFGEVTTSDYADSAAYVMQRSEGDERHRLVLSGTTSLPLALDLSFLGILASPRPFLVGTGRDDNQNGSDLDDWPGGVRTHRHRGWAHWYRTLDVRLARSLPFGRGRLTVTAEVFNLFNTANHAEYRPLSSLLDYAEPIADFARRQGQLGARYQF